MVHYFKGRNLTHLGCALGVTVGLTLGLILGAILAYSTSLTVVGWLVFGLTFGVGLAGWVLGAVFTHKNSTERQDAPDASRM
ncbi:MAG TPA: hypothetical protein VH540_20290 [Ktedonobacterales bacterium]|jgi:hypothetical protein